MAMAASHPGFAALNPGYVNAAMPQCRDTTPPGNAIES